MVEISVEHMSHHYGTRRAVDDLSFEVQSGEVFAFLGPNGGGKTTLFRVLSTLMPLQDGSVHIAGLDLSHSQMEIRRQIGVVFQSASLDKKLTVSENMRHQGALYGLKGEQLKSQTNKLLAQLGLTDRAADRVETLSGGLKRRVELAKGLIHQPRILLLDEPSTGLDPGARADLWKVLHELRDQFGVTILLTTHLLEEAAKADRIAILSRGRLVALDTPEALRASVGGDTLTLGCQNPEQLASQIGERFDLEPEILHGQLRLSQTRLGTEDSFQWIAKLREAFPDSIDSITLGKPTLEDVFIDKTGHQFWVEDLEAEQ